MSETTVSTPAGAAPAHLWVVAILAVLWNAYGAYEYVAVKLGEAGAWPGTSAGQAETLAAMPVWHTAVWAVGIWGALLAAILLLLRRRLAVPLFGLSLAALAVASIYTALSGAVDATATALAMTALLLVVAVFQFWYSRHQAARGVLR